MDIKEHEETLQSSEEYFSSYENLEVHRLLLSDDARTIAYKDAILKNAHLFEGKKVMDVGAGTGILSLFMAKAGATKVYAIEASKIANSIPAIAKENGFQHIIEVIHSEVENVSLPAEEKVDVIVSEWMGFYLLHESMLSSVIFARDHFLVEGGVMFPSEARIYISPCSTEELHKEEIQFWDNIHGFNFNPIKNLVLEAKSKKPTIAIIKNTDLLSNPICIKSFDLNYITNNEIKEFSCKNFVGITKAGNYHALCLWFDCDFNGIKYDSTGKRKGCNITLSTSPSFPATHWKQTVFLFSKTRLPTVNSNNKDENFSPADDYILEEDEVVGWNIKFSQDSNNPRFYNMEVELLDAETEEHPIPCSCPMARCVIINKMIENEEDDIEDMEQD